MFQLLESQGEEVSQRCVPGRRIGAANAAKKCESETQPQHYRQEHGRSCNRLATERLVRFGPQHNGYGSRSRRPHGGFLGQQRRKKEHETEKIAARGNRKKGAGYQESGERFMSNIETVQPTVQ